LTRLFLWTLVSAAAALPAAYVLGGNAEAARALVAVALCLTLTAGSLRFILWALPRGGNWVLASVLGGSFARMILVLGISTALFWLVPALGTIGFLLWVTFFYLLTLGLEVWLSVERLHRLTGATAVAT
jgi:hypothetical protein